MAAEQWSQRDDRRLLGSINFEQKLPRKWVKSEPQEPKDYTAQRCTYGIHCDDTDWGRLLLWCMIKCRRIITIVDDHGDGNDDDAYKTFAAATRLDPCCHVHTATCMLRRLRVIQDEMITMLQRWPRWTHLEMIRMLQRWPRWIHLEMIKMLQR